MRKAIALFLMLFVTLAWAGPQQDYARGADVYKILKAAEQGHADAQAALGLMYLEGRGVPQDDKVAAKWWRKAAEQGHSVAQSIIGVMYEKGRGVPQDYNTALKWYRKAAAQGDTRAKERLRRLNAEASASTAGKGAGATTPKNNEAGL